MITLDAQRATDRRRLEAYVAARPSPARFRKFAPTVRTTEPAKAREMRQGGFTPDVSMVATLVLPIGVPRPQEGKEIIEIQDMSGDYCTYDIRKVTPLLGYCCFQLDLAARAGKTSRTPPPRTN